MNYFLIHCLNRGINESNKRKFETELKLFSYINEKKSQYFRTANGFEFKLFKTIKGFKWDSLLKEERNKELHVF
jgi:hypothetical protein